MPAWQSAMKVADPYKANSYKSPAAPSVPAPGGVTDSGTAGSPGLPKASSIPAPGVSSPSVASPAAPKAGGVVGAGAAAGAMVANSVPQPPASTTGSSLKSPEYTDWLAKQNEAYANLEKLMSTPFSYDPNNDAGYQAQVNLAHQRADVATHGAMEAANEKGILGSSTNISQLGQIQQQAEQEAQSYIPQYREQAYGQYQNSIANAAQMLSAAAAGRQQQFGEATTEAGLTGTYQSPEARGLVDNLVAIKQQAEAQGITAEARAALSKQADGIRTKLSGMGVDISSLGANVNAKSVLGNAGSTGVKTLAAKDQEYGQATDKRNFDRGVLESDRSYDMEKAQQDWSNNFQQSQFDWQKAQQIWENTFQEKNFDQSVKQFAASQGLQWANLSQRQKEFVADQAFKDKQFQFSKDQFDYQKTQDTAAAQGQAPKAEDYFSSIDKSIYLSPEMTPGAFGGASQATGKTIVNDQAGLEKYILSLSLSDAEAQKLYYRYGLEWGK